MADPAKPSAPSKKPSASAPKMNLGRDIAIIAVVVLLVYISNNITSLSSENIYSGKAGSDIWSFLMGTVPLQAFLEQYLFPLKNFLVVVSMIFLAGIFWIALRMRAVHHKEHELFKAIPLEEVTAKEKMTQWQVVLNHINSENPAEWKIAILEADNMLDEILEEQGYVGDTVADKLKAMSRTRIASYDEVWEAHKVRNEIAHGGAVDMDLSKKLAHDTIARFGNAFRDLGYI